MRIVTKISAMTASVLVMSFTGIPVLAVGVNRNTNVHAETAVPATDADKKVAAQTKLADAKLKACQNREKAINNVMGKVAERGQKQLDLFTTIAERTEKFYTDKGKTLSNYDALVADVATKKSAAQTTVDAVKSTSTSFKCDGTDPKGAAQSFKDALKSEVEALKDYKTAVKNLIVGVKSVQGLTTSTDKETQGGQQ